MLNNEWNVLGVKCTLLWVMNVVSAYVGVLYGVACRLNVNRECGCGVLRLPACAEANDCVDQALLGYAVEEADEIVIDGCEMNVIGCGVEVCVELFPQVGDGKLSWMLREEV